MDTASSADCDEFHDETVSPTAVAIVKLITCVASPCCGSAAVSDGGRLAETAEASAPEQGCGGVTSPPLEVPARTRNQGENDAPSSGATDTTDSSLRARAYTAAAALSAVTLTPGPVAFALAFQPTDSGTWLLPHCKTIASRPAEAAAAAAALAHTLGGNVTVAGGGAGVEG